MLFNPLQTTLTSHYFAYDGEERGAAIMDSIFNLIVYAQIDDFDIYMMRYFHIISVGWGPHLK